MSWILFVQFIFSVTAAKSKSTYWFDSTSLHHFYRGMKLSRSLMMDGCSLVIVHKRLLNSRYLATYKCCHFNFFQILCFRCYDRLIVMNNTWICHLSFLSLLDRQLIVTIWYLSYIVNFIWKRNSRFYDSQFTRCSDTWQIIYIKTIRTMMKFNEFWWDFLHAW